MQLLCCGCFKKRSRLIPPRHTELSKQELKDLYERSIAANGGRLIVHGILARADTKNNNKRVYPKRILKREVTRYLKEHVRKGTALGELDHPSYSSKFFKCLNLPNISHQVLDMWWVRDCLWGTLEVLPTPSGLMLWELYSQGVRLGVSSRGWASLRTDPATKCVYVDDDYELITFDFVNAPSTRDAYLVPVMVKYRGRAVSQGRCVQLSHVGYGVVAMRKIQHLPSAGAVLERVEQIRDCALGKLAQISPLLGSHPLDNLLLFGHYSAHPQEAFLQREEHARDLCQHIYSFAIRAYLAMQSVAAVPQPAPMAVQLANSSSKSVLIASKPATHPSSTPVTTALPPRSDAPITNTSRHNTLLGTEAPPSPSLPSHPASGPDHIPSFPPSHSPAAPFPPAPLSPAIQTLPLSHPTSPARPTVSPLDLPCHVIDSSAASEGGPTPGCSSRSKSLLGSGNSGSPGVTRGKFKRLDSVAVHSGEVEMEAMGTFGKGFQEREEGLGQGTEGRDGGRWPVESKEADAGQVALLVLPDSLQPNWSLNTGISAAVAASSDSPAPPHPHSWAPSSPLPQDTPTHLARLLTNNLDQLTPAASLPVHTSGSLHLHTSGSHPLHTSGSLPLHPQADPQNFCAAIHEILEPPGYDLASRGSLHKAGALCGIDYAPECAIPSSEHSMPAAEDAACSPGMHISSGVDGSASGPLCLDGLAGCPTRIAQNASTSSLAGSLKVREVDDLALTRTESGSTLRMDPLGAGVLPQYVPPPSPELLHGREQERGKGEGSLPPSLFISHAPTQAVAMTAAPHSSDGAVGWGMERQERDKSYEQCQGQGIQSQDQSLYRVSPGKQSGAGVGTGMGLQNPLHGGWEKPSQPAGDRPTHSNLDRPSHSGQQSQVSMADGGITRGRSARAGSRRTATLDLSSSPAAVAQGSSSPAGITQGASQQRDVKQAGAHQQTTYVPIFTARSSYSLDYMPPTSVSIPPACMLHAHPVMLDQDSPRSSANWCVATSQIEPAPCTNVHTSSLAPSHSGGALAPHLATSSLHPSAEPSSHPSPRPSSNPSIQAAALPSGALSRSALSPKAADLTKAKWSMLSSPVGPLPVTQPMPTAARALPIPIAVYPPAGNGGRGQSSTNWVDGTKAWPALSSSQHLLYHPPCTGTHPPAGHPLLEPSGPTSSPAHLFQHTSDGPAGPSPQLCLSAEGSATSILFHLNSTAPNPSVTGAHLPSSFALTSLQPNHASSSPYQPCCSHQDTEVPLLPCIPTMQVQPHAQSLPHAAAAQPLWTVPSTSLDHPLTQSKPLHSVATHAAATHPATAPPAATHTAATPAAAAHSASAHPTAPAATYSPPTHPAAPSTASQPPIGPTLSSPMPCHSEHTRSHYLRNYSRDSHPSSSGLASSHLKPTPAGLNPSASQGGWPLNQTSNSGSTTARPAADACEDLLFTSSAFTAEYHLLIAALQPLSSLPPPPSTCMSTANCPRCCTMDPSNHPLPHITGPIKDVEQPKALMHLHAASPKRCLSPYLESALSQGSGPLTEAARSQLSGPLTNAALPVFSCPWTKAGVSHSHHPVTEAHCSELSPLVQSHPTATSPVSVSSPTQVTFLDAQPTSPPCATSPSGTGTGNPNLVQLASSNADLPELEHIRRLLQQYVQRYRQYHQLIAQQLSRQCGLLPLL